MKPQSAGGKQINVEWNMKQPQHKILLFEKWIQIRYFFYV